MLLINIFVLTFGFIQNVHPSNGQKTVRGRIVGGSSQNILQAPHMLQLFKYDRFKCGASLIRKKVALTAAHCTYRATTSSLYVLGGSSTLHLGDYAGVESIHEHINYNDDTLHADISILKLQNEILNPNVKVIQLYNAAVPDGAVVQVSGWGHTKQSGDISKQLQKVDLIIVPRWNCSYYHGLITSDLICAHAQGKDACQGDSGGGMLYNGKLAGIVSFGGDCGTDAPGVYTNLLFYMKFIEDTLSSLKI